MRLLAQNFLGQLDISSPERLDKFGESVTDSVQYRRSVRVGDIVDIPDEYLSFPNIKGAINAGFLVLVSRGIDQNALPVRAEISSGTTFDPVTDPFVNALT